MFSNFLKTAWRNLVRNKMYGILNITGLAVGMAVSFLLLVYVWHEYSWDRSFPNADRIYLVYKHQPVNGAVRTKPLSPQPLSAVLQKDYPAVEKVARTNAPGEDLLISYGDKGLRVNTVAADSSLTDLFAFSFLAGDQRNPLHGPSIVLTESIARALFGQTDPIGQVVRVANQYPLKVTAVIRDRPDNTSLSFKALLSWDAFLQEKPWVRDMGWDNYAYASYVMLRPGASVDAVNAKVSGLIGQYFPEDKDIKLFLYPLLRLHLYNEFRDGLSNGGRIAYVRLFFFLAIGILLVAAINFMNLSTARSEKRAREVGVRKVVGAGRATLVVQFLSESVLLAGLAFILALGLMILALPLFDGMIHIPLTLPFENPQAWGLGLGITIGTGLLAGSYPALFLSSFQPIKVLKGQLLRVRAAVKPRQVLVVTQFSFAISLIIASLVVYRQIDLIRNRPVGYERKGLVEMTLDGNMETHFESFRQAAIRQGYITDAAITSAPITQNNSATWSVKWPGQQPGENKIPIDCMGATYHFMETYGLRMLQGRTFDAGMPGDTAAILLNRAAVRLMRFEQPLGQEIVWMGAKRRVVGVVDDFVWGSPYEPVKAAIIGFVPGWTGNIGLRLNPAKPVSVSLAGLQDLYKQYDPGYPFAYRFTDAEFAEKFRDEELLGSVALAFTGLAIFIACLGLFGLSAFSAGQRRKELGIRKVLGAGTAGLWFLLSREFLGLMLIACVVGSAVSGFLLPRWLGQYTYHASMGVSVYLIPVLAGLAVCLLAVSWQAFRAASANPVLSLRNE